MKKQELRHDAFRENAVKGIEYINENRATAIKIFALIVFLTFFMIKLIFKYRI